MTVWDHLIVFGFPVVGSLFVYCLLRFAVSRRI